MRLSNNLFAAMIASSLACGCAIPLEPVDDAAATETVAGFDDECRLMEGAHPDLVRLGGSARSISLGADEFLWIFDSATFGTGSASSPARELSAAGALTKSRVACGGAPPLLGAPSSLLEPPDIGPVLMAVPLGGVRHRDNVWLYHAVYEPDAESDFGVRLLGHSVASWDPADETFHAAPNLLWYADRPAYGGAALAAGDDVYVYGCKPGEWLSYDCYVARAPTDHVENELAYTYYAGAYRWSANPDLATPIVSAGPTVSVRHHRGQGRYLMTTIGAFGHEIEARVSVAPEGPWSAPVVLASCTLPDGDEGAFCAGVQQHPELLHDPSARRVVISYAVVSWPTEDGHDPVASSPGEYWARLGEVRLPDTLH